MQRLLRLLVGPMVGFGVSALITVVGLYFLPRDTVAPLAVGGGLAAVTYFSPVSRRRRNLPFSLALGALIATFMYVALRLLSTAPA